MALYYCRRCGRIAQESYTRSEEICDCCGNILYPVPKNYLLEEFDFIFKDEGSKQTLIEDLVKTSPEFDPYLFEHRDEILEKQSADLNAKLEHGKAILEEKNRLPRCPSCGSTNISKIGLVSRGVSTLFLGLASSKIGSTHKCNNCGTTW